MTHKPRIINAKLKCILQKVWKILGNTWDWKHSRKWKDESLWGLKHTLRYDALFRVWWALGSSATSWGSGFFIGNYGHSRWNVCSNAITFCCYHLYWQKSFFWQRRSSSQAGDLELEAGWSLLHNSNCFLAFLAKVNAFHPASFSRPLPLLSHRFFFDSS